MNRHKLTICIKILLNAVIFLCIIYAGKGLCRSYSNQKLQKKLKAIVETAEDETAEDESEETQLLRVIDESENKKLKEDSTDEEDVLFDEEAGTRAYILSEYAALYEMNQDLIGWLKIEGTMIDYPVVKGEDNQFYLDHDFEGGKSKYGCLFVKSFADMDANWTNYIIYGHNMKDGSMFGQLKKYKEEDFYKKHSNIIFHSLYEKRTYEIVAIFLSQVYSMDYEGFKYYEFYHADTKEEFIYFYNNIKALSLYDTGVSAEFGDKFITLSTCDYHTEDGRLVVVAKEK